MKKVALILSGLLLWGGAAWAVPEMVSVRVTDVTTSSFSVVWMTDVAAAPEVEVYDDSSMSNNLNQGLSIVPMPDAPTAVAEAARQKGIMKVRVSGLAAQTTYYVRAVTRDPAQPDSIGYSSLQEVTTAATVVPFKEAQDGTLASLDNDLLSFPVYIAPSDPSERPGLGDLLLLETDGSPYPISAFAGAGAADREGILDLNNLFGQTGVSLAVAGGEKALLRIYRGGTLSTLLHYRRFPANSGQTAVAEPVQGFFADLNLDGKVDAADFELFKAQYRLGADDAAFNPDYNFIPVQAGKTASSDRIDARDFARFATQYGRTGVK